MDLFESLQPEPSAKVHKINSTLELWYGYLSQYEFEVLRSFKSIRNYNWHDTLLVNMMATKPTNAFQTGILNEIMRNIL